MLMLQLCIWETLTVGLYDVPEVWVCWGVVCTHTAVGRVCRVVARIVKKLSDVEGSSDNSNDNDWTLFTATTSAKKHTCEYIHLSVACLPAPTVVL